MYTSDIKEGACAVPDNGVKTSAETVTHVHSVLAARVEDRLNRPDVVEALRNRPGPRSLSQFMIAGGALLRDEPRDLDLWPPVANEYVFLDQIAVGAQSSKIVTAGGTIIQLCRQRAANLTALIEAFDFAHCQVGACVSWGVRDVSGDIGFKVDLVQYTPAFAAAMLVQGTFYTNAHWPVNGLERVHRIATKLRLNDDEARTLTKQVVKKAGIAILEVPVPEVLGYKPPSPQQVQSDREFASLFEQPPY